MSNNISNRIKNIISIVLEISANEIDDNLSPENIMSWDSLKHINLVIALEEEFEIEFSEDQIPQLNSYLSIREIILSKIP